MSDFVQQKLNRRQFLRAGLAVASGLAALGPRPGRADDRQECLRWAFLSDTHIAANPDSKHRGFCPYRNLQEVTAQIASSPPDGLVLTGDLASRAGRAGDYENLRDLLAPITDSRPAYLGIGNHDDRAHFLSAFANSEQGARALEGRHVVTVKTGPVRFIILDSLLFVDLPWGQLGRAQRDWLRTYLRVCDDTPTILIVHHPIAGKDALLDARRLLDLIKPVAKVKALVHGHSHAFGLSRCEGLHVISLPATGYSIQDTEPVGWVEARLTSDHGEFALHAIGGNTGLDGSTKRLRWRT
jgi:Icc protein